MFAWEQSIDEWRRTVAGQPGLTPETVAELESHLRDEMQRQLAAGIEPERAWTLALEQLGTPEALAREFTKVAGEKTAPWWPLRVAAGITGLMALVLVGWLTSRCLDGRVSVLLAVHVGAITIGYSLSFVAALLTLCWIVEGTIRTRRPEQTRGLARGLYFLMWIAAGATGVGVLLGGVWAKEHMGRFWGWDPKETGGAVVLLWNVLMVLFLRRCAGKEEDAILLGLVGSVLVWLAWFGVADLPGLTRTILALVVLAHGAIYLLGLAQVRHMRRWL
jgi:hypothetical protein